MYTYSLAKRRSKILCVDRKGTFAEDSRRKGRLGRGSKNEQKLSCWVRQGMALREEGESQRNDVKGKS